MERASGSMILVLLFYFPFGNDSDGAARHLGFPNRRYNAKRGESSFKIGEYEFC
jgi:hypothetical protein